jgi:hypothetical protein
LRARISRAAAERMPTRLTARLMTTMAATSPFRPGLKDERMQIGRVDVPDRYTNRDMMTSSKERVKAPGDS